MATRITTHPKKESRRERAREQEAATSLRTCGHRHTDNGEARCASLHPVKG